MEFLIIHVTAGLIWAGSCHGESKVTVVMKEL